MRQPILISLIRRLTQWYKFFVKKIKLRGTWRPSKTTNAIFLPSLYFFENFNFVMVYEFILVTIYQLRLE